MTEKFDFNEALKAIQSGQGISGKDGVLAPLVKQLTEAALDAELESHIADDVLPNRKNGKSSKTLKTSEGRIDLNTPRDRAGTFEPQIVKKHQTSVSDEIESKILSMYGRGLSYSDISEHVAEIYGISVSTAAISAITDKIVDTVKAWQQRPLESHYPFVWLDAIHYKVRAQGHYESRAVYTVLGLNLEGRKEVLGLYLSESEGANFWLGVLSDLQNRGVKDILIASVDGLTGFPGLSRQPIQRLKSSFVLFIKFVIHCAMSARNITRHSWLILNGCIKRSIKRPPNPPWMSLRKSWVKNTRS